MRSAALILGGLVVLLGGALTFVVVRQRSADGDPSAAVRLDQELGEMGRRVEALDERLAELRRELDKLTARFQQPTEDERESQRAELLELRERLRRVEAQAAEAVSATRNPNPGAGELLRIVRNSELSRDKRNKAIWELLDRSDVDQNLEAILAFYRQCDDEVLRNSLENVLRTVADRLRSQRVIDVVMDDVRDRGGAGASPSVLAKFYGEERVEEIERYLADGSEKVQEVAVAAISLLGKSEKTLSSLNRAQGHANPVVRGVASFSLANLGEPFYYEGVIDDWRQILFSHKYKLLYSIPKFDPTRMLRALPDGGLQEALTLFTELSTNHEDPRIREAVAKALETRTKPERDS